MKKIKKQAIIEYLESLAYSHSFDFYPIGFRIKLDDWAFTKGQFPQMPLCYFQAIGKPFFLTRKEFGKLTYRGD